jgi:hypothetical protein
VNCCVCNSVKAAFLGVTVIEVTFPPELLEELLPEELPPEELPLEEVAPEELLLDDPPLEPPELEELPELLELLELLEEDPPLLLDDPGAPGPGTTA